MGVFEFIIMLVLITTAGNVISRRRLRRPDRGDSLQVGTEELHRIRDTIGDLSGRVERLEEERDFYKDLLDPAKEGRRLIPGEGDEES